MELAAIVFAVAVGAGIALIVAINRVEKHLNETNTLVLAMIQVLTSQGMWPPQPKPASPKPFLLG